MKRVLRFSAWSVALAGSICLGCDPGPGAAGPASGASAVETPTGPAQAKLPSLGAQDLQGAKSLSGFAYVDTKAFKCGGKEFEVARFKHKETGLIFHLVPGGTYKRGSPAGEPGRYPNEGPLREVTVRPFLICATECTQSVWKQVMGTNPSEFKGDQHSVETVSWNDTQSFCGNSGLRLPSEAEWEYACRAGTASAYSFGDNPSDLGRFGQFNESSDADAKPGLKLPNAFGLFDMHGSLWEWCQDAFEDSYSASPSDGSAREIPGASKRVYRGGSRYNTARILRSAVRGSSEPDFRGNLVGFRPAKSLP